ncbi:tRNA (guanine(37)-N1)-methyltransferase, putative (macronuclear) [Tetrahymena thermophila SB210]|uniref:tRNA (guanine(37)-N1)-methyltransferase n=1 Tax=Tetrahymena thermophila (strain SB210) TaxID=312017 RepID=W7XD08_TETTS|nr:tRNA (guanine(37)-N1)-methyltransferase, putative [Tetrahymena thermophila SB210]EWS71696.1 tRNA (guanine(37)-N1)-methyltransferase, putative [Tetrahymena thermophila SB210]|eukprot:XP_012655768.1 tRNA (guanine(37)-N1)-methyltransferase, putative [Tetrahymena thermophila SB210]
MIPEHLVKEDYNKVIKVSALKVENKQINEVMNGVKDQFLDIQNVKRIVPFKNEKGVDNNLKLILLQECLKKDSFDSKWPEALKKKVQDFGLEIVDYEVNIGFDNIPVNEILEKIIPAEIGVPTGYETVGHIAHFNLKPQQYPYKHLIGQVIIEKFKNIKTVVNKLDKLHNVYRTPELEIMAGENKLETEHKEDKCIFKLDFEKVYFCSRLQTERDRVLKLIKPNETVLDLFCGVGPLAIRAAKMGCKVICNDLNPHCYDYLLINREKNNVEDKTLCFNNDARKVVDILVSKEEYKKYPSEFHHFDHVYMNLPVDNIEFCDVFQGLLKKGSPEVWNENNLPMIHATGFVSGEEEDECKQLIEERAKQILPHFKKEHIEHFNIIKNVTATKKMFCISFKLSVEDANDEPSKGYTYVTPEREAESYPIVKDFGKNATKKIKKD